jgi:hypothetical protein
MALALDDAALARVMIACTAVAPAKRETLLMHFAEPNGAGRYARAHDEISGGRLDRPSLSP